MPKRKIIIISLFLFFVVIGLIFILSLKQQNIAEDALLSASAIKSIEINTDCDINVKQGTALDSVGMNLSGLSRQFFKMPAYKLAAELSDGVLKISVVNNTAFFIKDIRNITLNIYLPLVSDLDITINAGQGKFCIENVEFNSLTMNNAKGSAAIKKLKLNKLDIVEFSGNTVINDSNIQIFNYRSRTGKLFVNNLNTAVITANIIAGEMAFNNIIGFSEILKINLCSEKGKINLAVLCPDTEIDISTDSSHVSLQVPESAYNLNLKSEKGTVQNTALHSSEASSFITIKSNYGNIVIETI